jgi:acyl carrier protein
MIDEVRALIAEHADVGKDDDALEVASFVLVVIAEALEEKFGVRVTAKEMIPANFGSIQKIAEYVEAKRAHL